MARLSEKNREILLVALNRIIDEQAECIAGKIGDGSFGSSISYPPGVDLSESEKNLLMEISNIAGIGSLLRKILAESSSRIIFELLNWIDGTGDPDDPEWDGVAIVDNSYVEDEGDVMLHDEFFERYWDWKKRK